MGIFARLLGVEKMDPFAQATLAMARAGDPGAQCMLGQFYACGEHGLPQDYQLAGQWLAKATHGGDGYAFYYLGYALYDGHYPTVDIKNLARGLNMPQPLRRDIIGAILMLREAVARGIHEAEAALDKVLRENTFSNDAIAYHRARLQSQCGIIFIHTAEATT